MPPKILCRSRKSYIAHIIPTYGICCIWRIMWSHGNTEYGATPTVLFCICVSVWCMCVGMWAGVHSCIGVETREGCQLSCFNSLWGLPLETVSLTGPRDRLASSKSQWSSCLHPCSTEVTGICGHAQVFTSALEFIFRSLCLGSKGIYPLSHLSIPSTMF